MRRWWVLAGVTAGVAALDQITKWWVRGAIPLHGWVAVLQNVFDLVHLRNRGGAFGMFAGLPAT